MPVRPINVIVEEHPDGFVAYATDLPGIVIGQGDTYDEVMADFRSALEFHVETFGL